jgi:hypothetical protein
MPNTVAAQGWLLPGPDLQAAARDATTVGWVVARRMTRTSPS